MDNNLKSMCETVAEQSVPLNCEVLKTCPKCRITKRASDFSKRARNKDGIGDYCKECDSRNNKAVRERNKARPVIIVPEFKTCPECKTEKTSSKFSKVDSNKDGLQNRCKECNAKDLKKYRKKNKARENVVIPAFKYCPGCKLEKPSSYFYKINGNKDGLQSWCKECALVHDRERKYGITPEQFNAMLLAQGGACAICKWIPGPEEYGLDTDHIHGTDIVRGLLHRRCNTG